METVCVTHDSWNFHRRSIGREKSIRLNFCLLQLNFIFFYALCSLFLRTSFIVCPYAVIFMRFVPTKRLPKSNLEKEKRIVVSCNVSTSLNIRAGMFVAWTCDANKLLDQTSVDNSPKWNYSVASRRTMRLVAWHTGGQKIKSNQSTKLTCI